MREHAPGDDPDGRHVVGAGRWVAALAHDAIRDVGVGPDEVVRPDVLEDERAVTVDAGPDADLAGCAADRLECLLEAQDEAHGAPGPQGGERDERLELGMLLAAEPTPGIRREDANLREREPEHLRDHLLQPVRVLDRAPDGDPVTIGNV